MANLNGESKSRAPEVKSLKQIAVQGSQWCDVQDREALSVGNLEQLVEYWKENCFRFARSGGCDQKNILSLNDLGNRGRLRWSGSSYS